PDPPGHAIEGLVGQEVPLGYSPAVEEVRELAADGFVLAARRLPAGPQPREELLQVLGRQPDRSPICRGRHDRRDLTGRVRHRDVTPGYSPRVMVDVGHMPPWMVAACAFQGLLFFVCAAGIVVLRLLRRG